MHPFPRIGRKLVLICLIAGLFAACNGHAAVLWEDEEGKQKLDRKDTCSP